MERISFVGRHLHKRGLRSYLSIECVVVPNGDVNFHWKTEKHLEAELLSFVDCSIGENFNNKKFEKKIYYRGILVLHVQKEWGDKLIIYSSFL